MPEGDTNQERKNRNCGAEQSRIDNGCERQAFNEKELIEDDAQQAAQNQPNHVPGRELAESAQASTQNEESKSRAGDTKSNQTRTGDRTQRYLANDGPCAKEYLD